MKLLITKGQIFLFANHMVLFGLFIWAPPSNPKSIINRVNYGYFN